MVWRLDARASAPFVTSIAMLLFSASARAQVAHGADRTGQDRTGQSPPTRQDPQEARREAIIERNREIQQQNQRMNDAVNRATQDAVDKVRQQYTPQDTPRSDERRFNDDSSNSDVPIPRSGPDRPQATGIYTPTGLGTGTLEFSRPAPRPVVTPSAPSSAQPTQYLSAESYSALRDLDSINFSAPTAAGAPVSPQNSAASSDATSEVSGGSSGSDAFAEFRRAAFAVKKAADDLSDEFEQMRKAASDPKQFLVSQLIRSVGIDDTPTGDPDSPTAAMNQTVIDATKMAGDDDAHRKQARDALQSFFDQVDVAPNLGPPQ